MLTRHADIDMIPGGDKTVVNINQYDSAFDLVLHPYASTGTFSIPSGTTATFRGTKPDGNGYSESAAVDVENLTVTVSGDQQITAVAGIVNCEIVLFEGGKELCSANFVLKVARAAMDSDTITSESRVRELADVIGRSDEIIDAANDAKTYRDAAKAYRDTTAVYAEYVEDHAEEINASVAAAAQAKTYRDDAQTAKTQAESAKSAAETARQNAASSASTATSAATTAQTASEAATAAATKSDAILAPYQDGSTWKSRTLETMQNGIDAAAEATGSGVVCSLGFDTDEDGKSYYLGLDANGDVISRVEAVGGSGGGGGGSSGTYVSMSRKNPANYKVTVATGNDCPITFEWSTKMRQGDTWTETGEPGTLIITVAGVERSRIEVSPGEVTQNIRDYLPKSGDAISVRFTIVDNDQNTSYLAYSINVAALSIAASTFNAAQTFVDNDARPYASIPYTITGSMEKTIHVVNHSLADARQNVATIQKSGAGSDTCILTYARNQLRYGENILELYATATVDGVELESNHLRFAIICASAAAVASAFLDSEPVDQYSTVNIPYRVWDPTTVEGGQASVSITVTLAGTQKFYGEYQVENLKEETFSYIADTATETGQYLTVTIASGGASKTLSLTVKKAAEAIEAIKDQLELFLSSAGKSNTATEGYNAYNRNQWHSTPSTWGGSGQTIRATLSNFYYSYDKNSNPNGDGWAQDDQGNTVLRLTGNDTVTIPFQPFSTEINPASTDSTTSASTGKTIEIEFATHNVMDLDAVIFSCFQSIGTEGDGRGLVLTPRKFTFQSQNFSKDEAVTGPYMDGERIRFSLVIEPPSRANPLIRPYLNGVAIQPFPYESSDRFQNSGEMTASAIGATVDLYTIRVYNRSLSMKEILMNWIADAQSDRLIRYQRNYGIFDGDEPSDETLPRITIGKIRTNMQNLPVVTYYAPSLPARKGNPVSGAVALANPRDDSTGNIEKRDAEIDVQGTSSATYPVKNNLITFGSNFTYALRVGAFPVGVFCMKADVASSEGANNVELVRLYEFMSRELGILTPPQWLQQTNGQSITIRQGIDGFPAVIFWQQTDNLGNPVGDPAFQGKFNFNNDKSTANVFGFQAGDECWETKDNSHDLCLFKGTTFSEENKKEWYNVAYEGRYPKNNRDNTKLKKLVEWVYSTWQEQATNATLASPVTLYSPLEGKEKTFQQDTAEYRLAKFRAEFTLENGGNLNLNSATFYYLFVFSFLMVDSRAKNAFPTWFGKRTANSGETYGGEWFWLPYDMDTALGNDNEGKLVIEPFWEDIDQYNDRDVFDGQSSVLWTNFRQAFWPEITAMYQRLRANSGYFSAAGVEKLFDEHQDAWSPAIFNVDAHNKYIRPFLTGGQNNLAMMLGDKRLQRKPWLTDRFNYLDTLFYGTSSSDNIISFRAGYESGATLTIKPFSDIYLSANFDTNTAGPVRSQNRQAVTLRAPNLAGDANYSVVTISSANLISEIDGLTALHAETASFAPAVKLLQIVMGSDATDARLSRLTLPAKTTSGETPLLQVLDCRNCSILAGTISLSDCVHIREVYLEGSAVNNIVLPDGGVLETLRLPANMTSLTIQNQLLVRTFSIEGCARLQSLVVENVSSTVWSTVFANDGILANLPDDAFVVSLKGFSTNLSSLAALEAWFARFETFGRVELSGVVTLTSGTITAEARDAYMERYPNVFIAGNISATVTFKNFDGSTLSTATASLRIAADGTVTPGSVQYASTPTFDNGHNSYTFIGWSWTEQSRVNDADDALQNVEGDLTLYAAYNITGSEFYTVTFYDYLNNVETSLGSVTDIPWGCAVPMLDVPVAARDGNGLSAEFLGWSINKDAVTPDETPLANVTENRTLYAVFGDVMIVDSWSAILSNIQNNAYKTRYPIGAIVRAPLDLGGYGSMQMRLVAKDENSTTSTSWMARKSLGVFSMDASATDEVEPVINTKRASITASVTPVLEFAFYGVGAKRFKNIVSVEWKKTTWQTYLYNGKNGWTFNSSDGTITLSAGGGSGDSTRPYGSALSWRVICRVQDGSTVTIPVYPRTTGNNKSDAQISELLIGVTPVRWDTCALRTGILEDIYAMLPAALQNAIQSVSVNKNYSYFETLDSAEPQESVTSEKLWLPAASELSDGGAYATSFPDAASRVVMDDNGNATAYWLRDAGDDALSFSCVTEEGEISSEYAANQKGVVFGFCL